MDGGLGEDYLKGESGNDNLIGGSGPDLLNGGDGNDTLTGGLDSDIFRMSKGNDTVTDFRPGDSDKIELYLDGITGKVSIFSYDSYVLLQSASGDTMTIREATGLDVFESIVDAHKGQVVAENFEVLA